MFHPNFKDATRKGRGIGAFKFGRTFQSALTEVSGYIAGRGKVNCQIWEPALLFPHGHLKHRSKLQEAVRDPLGKFKDKYLFTTDLTSDLGRIIYGTLPRGTYCRQRMPRVNVLTSGTQNGRLLAT